MMRATWAGVVGLGLAALAAGGCEPPSTPDGLMREQLGHLKALTAACENKEPFETHWGISSKMKAAADKFEKLKPTDEQREELRRRYLADFTAAMNRFQPAASKAVAAEPRLVDPLNDAVDAVVRMMPWLGGAR